MIFFTSLRVESHGWTFYDPVDENDIKFHRREIQVVNKWKGERKLGISLPYKVKHFS